VRNRAAEGCHLSTLASGSVCQVQRCSHCASLSLVLGPITLRFDPSALESVWNTLGEALLTLQREAPQDRILLPKTPTRGSA
jgi:hypothetical protein